MSANWTKRYLPELKGRAVRMVAETRADRDSERASMTAVGAALGVGTPKAIRRWVRQAEIDAGNRLDTTSVKAAFIAAEPDRPGRRGVEPIWTVLTEHGRPIALSTYYEDVNLQPSAPDRSDRLLLTEIRRVLHESCGGCGARKGWLQPDREGHDVARLGLR